MCSWNVSLSPLSPPRSEINNGSPLKNFRVSFADKCRKRERAKNLTANASNGRRGEGKEEEEAKNTEFTQATQAKRNGGYLQRDETSRHRAKLVKPMAN